MPCSDRQLVISYSVCALSYDACLSSTQPSRCDFVYHSYYILIADKLIIALLHKPIMLRFMKRNLKKIKYAMYLCYLVYIKCFHFMANCFSELPTARCYQLTSYVCLISHQLILVWYFSYFRIFQCITGNSPSKLHVCH